MRGVLLAALAGFALGCATPAEEVAPTAPPAPPEPDPVFEPAPNVRCDRPSEVCTWKGGPSVGLTRLFFGDAAADRLAPAQRAASYPNDPIFKPDPWVSCDTLVLTCYDALGSNAEYTRRQFGEEAVDRLEARLAAIDRLDTWLVCDRTSEVCYDRLGATVGATRIELGVEASERLLRRLRPWLRRESR